MGFNTEALHKGLVKDESFGATITPVYQVSAFGYKDMETLERVFGGKSSGFAYTRIGNPTVASFESRINALEHGFGAVATASGMAAISHGLMNFLSAGDNIIASAGLYGGTIQLFSIFKQFNISITYTSDFSHENLEKLYKENTKAIFAETIGNPSLTVIDIASIAEFAHKKGIPLVIDNTTATPFLVTPIDLGADIVIHSSSKYINGSADAISGVVIYSGKFKWDFDRFPALKEYKAFSNLSYLVRLRKDFWASMGGCLSPFNAFLNIIGLETLGLRIQKINDNARILAEELNNIEGISVNYPLLKGNSNRELAQRQLKGYGGGILTISTGSREKAFKLINSLKTAIIASNIGDVRTLVIYPATTLFLHNTKEEMNAAGVFDDTVRVSVGIEDIEDLLADFRQAIL
ncbi:aminotransferase class V-fold PLP-dependent enzyme [Treponema sp.]|uniref:O-acetylhomoserine aminocarboxypropyltransferase/cysteine synthase family protein n=1 Tax=Treponema sp. TaxID=166 RepID=UPI0025D17442|nr:aminotransferase class V-fold PLP-dependent enzyme [Treponema sp.]MBR4322227.1 O-acetylhomoserine aminocarboxypropyltransferase/cysteine synthase [Treponema sp.]